MSGCRRLHQSRFPPARSPEARTPSKPISQAELGQEISTKYHNGAVRQGFSSLWTNVTELLPIASNYVSDNYLIKPTEDTLVCIDVGTKYSISGIYLQCTRPRLPFAKSYETGAIYAVIIGNNPDNSE